MLTISHFLLEQYLLDEHPTLPLLLDMLGCKPIILPHDYRFQEVSRFDNKEQYWDNCLGTNHNEPMGYMGSLNTAKYLSRLFPARFFYLSKKYFSELYVSSYSSRSEITLHLLNYPVVFLPLKSFFSGWANPNHPLANNLGEGYFIRPDSPYKEFTGQVVTSESYSEFLFYNRLDNTKETNLIWTGVSQPKTIEAEFRAYVGSKGIVTMSEYKPLETIIGASHPAYEYLDNLHKHDVFTQLLADTHGGLVVDVAQTLDGYKLLEFNHVCTSGIYSCNPIAVLNLINEVISYNDTSDDD